MYKIAALFIVFFLLMPGEGWSASSAPASAQTAAADTVTLAFAGDILLDGFVGEQIDKYGVNFPFAKVAPVLKKADLAFANLETPVSLKGEPAVKSFVFRSKPATLGGLVYAGIDGVTLANNHILDYGPAAMLDTLDYLDQYKIGHTGAGRNSTAAFKPFVRTIKGKTISIIGASRVLSGPSWHAGPNHAGAAQAYTAEPLVSAVKQAAETSDYTIVYLHWNQEFKDYPEKDSRTLAKKLIDSGADLVLGAHSHCLMGIEYYKHKPIYYSLGNFVFNRSTRGGDKTLHSMLLHINLTASGVTAKITPVKIAGGQPNFMNAAYNKGTIATLNKLSFNAKVAADGTVSEKM
ncbi:CapA family protein [Paenibacillus sp. NFR01]|uniref:CapA family protein n=1 Tax=Paenibacillus sp. NFR01 TaxID=1566279 RepID=UPI0008C45BD9|nr:CapA family protein [Paenibacillus sp. NFR01]SES92328.1 poly-gamma-glutamate synthesis protein (capsule biosynthesis protein) [Paenibacillus sp. NFR01]